MFDITQVRSALKKKSLKEDIEYIDNTLNEVIYTEDFNDNNIDINIPSYKEEIDSLKKISHTHENMPVLKRITNSMIDSWNSISPTKLSQLINDSDFVNKEYVENRISELTGNSLKDIVLTSDNGNQFILTTDSDGKLITCSTNLDSKINSKIILTSPNGQNYLLNVDKDGVLNPIKIL